MEGKKSWPRQPPMFPTNFGLMGFPTVVHNVATLAMLPHIVVNGGMVRQAHPQERRDHALQRQRPRGEARV